MVLLASGLLVVCDLWIFIRDGTRDRYKVHARMFVECVLSVVDRFWFAFYKYVLNLPDDLCFSTSIRDRV